MKELQYAGSILGALISDETDLKLKGLFLQLLLDGDFLTEDKLMGGIGGDFSGEGHRVVLNFHFAGEVDLHLDGGYVDAVLVNVGLGVGVHE